MRTLTFDRICLSVVVTSMLIHLFCCGIPLLLSVGSLAAMVGVSSTEWAFSHVLEGYEQTILIVSGAILLINGFVQIISERINCRTDGDCTHAPCETKNHTARTIYFIALGLFVLNLAFFFAEH